MQPFALRKPELVPLLFIIAATVFLCGVGIWQLERLHWKNTLIQKMEAAQEQPAVGNLPADAAETAALEYRNAVLTGIYMEDKRLRFVGRQTGGYVWMVPLKLEDSDMVVLVALPWLPSGKEPQLEKGLQTVRGILRPPSPKRLFSPANHEDLNVWFTEDLPVIERNIGVAVVPLILDTYGKPNLRNDHLGYAITWFSLAIIGLVMFGLYYRKR